MLSLANQSIPSGKRWFIEGVFLEIVSWTFWSITQTPECKLPSWFPILTHEAGSFIWYNCIQLLHTSIKCILMNVVMSGLVYGPRLSQSTYLYPTSLATETELSLTLHLAYGTHCCLTSQHRTILQSSNDSSNLTSSLTSILNSRLSTLRTGTLEWKFFVRYCWLYKCCL